MKYAARARSELGVKTLFNLLGPMTNPAGVRRQLVGAFSPQAAQKMAGVFSHLDSFKVLVIHSKDGLDEVSLEATTTVYEIKSRLFNGKVYLKPNLFGLAEVKRESIRGGSAETNASIAVSILEGHKTPQRDIVLANASLALLAAEKARTVQEGVHFAEESIDSGRALRKLEDLRAYTTRLTFSRPSSIISAKKSPDAKNKRPSPPWPIWNSTDGPPHPCAARSGGPREWRSSRR